ncbi:unnamed protein product [Caretta caretta]
MLRGQTQEGGAGGAVCPADRLLPERRLPPSPAWLHGEQFQSIARGPRDTLPQRRLHLTTREPTPGCLTKGWILSQPLPLPVPGGWHAAQLTRAGALEDTWRSPSCSAHQ